LKTKVDLTPFEKSLKSLKAALAQPKDEFIRDSVIQRFEFTFEISWKTLKRYFEWNQNLSESNIKNLFREAGKQALIDSVENWFSYQIARNESSHTYNENKAEEIYQIAGRFATDAEMLLTRLKKLV
jgi:nucleotidyltransferase substrate binding protein (TIGR01987 family)